MSLGDAALWEDLIRDSGGARVRCTVGDVEHETWGHLGTSDLEVLERMEVIVDGAVLTIATGTLPASSLTSRAEISVNGVPYRIHRALRRPTDPALTDVALLEA